MRTIVDLPEHQVTALDVLGENLDLSRAELVRRAVDLYLGQQKKKRSDAAIETYYGFLKDVPEAFGGLDGLAYQEKIRSEWDHRDTMYSNWAMHEDPPKNTGDFQIPDTVKQCKKDS